MYGGLLFIMSLETLVSVFCLGMGIVNLIKHQPSKILLLIAVIGIISLAATFLYTQTWLAQHLV
ncbi:hypothetical protein IV38_GL001332 [Lactobacillus selangorensis]|uniref:Uncharacterized protein n=2 Tax=Lactobacillus selangorensis TaxID=81857 RepID=A0A0R2FW05_9LACO|nr:hypothetical protein IV38_GL001332 [Lactobacillus selangorensis]KRN31835.1 hypothetical protein IV40_GL001119 [Lactobacillus selangorensis]